MNARTATPLLRMFVLGIILAVTWLLWSGLYKPLLLGLGALSVALTLWLARRIGTFDEPSPFAVVLRLPRLWGWLFVEIVKSSIDVARVVLDPKLPISPTVVEFKTRCKGPIGQVILGNGMTLSPGTVTLDVFEDHITVHCLTAAAARDLEAGELDRRVSAATEH